MARCEPQQIMINIFLNTWPYNKGPYPPFGPYLQTNDQIALKLFGNQYMHLFTNHLLTYSPPKCPLLMC
jgi:hypothetical protein